MIVILLLALGAWGMLLLVRDTWRQTAPVEPPGRPGAARPQRKRRATKAADRLDPQPPDDGALSWSALDEIQLQRLLRNSDR